MTIDYVKNNKIAYITLNRPEARNALDPDTLEALGKTWLDFRDDPSVLVAIITGVGNSFCATVMSSLLRVADHDGSSRHTDVVAPAAFVVPDIENELVELIRRE